MVYSYYNYRGVHVYSGTSDSGPSISIHVGTQYIIDLSTKDITGFPIVLIHFKPLS